MSTPPPPQLLTERSEVSLQDIMVAAAVGVDEAEPRLPGNNVPPPPPSILIY